MTNKESNFMFNNKEYIHNKIEWDPNSDQNQFLSDGEIEKKMYEKASNYVQQFEADTELRAYLMTQQILGIKSILLYYSAEVLDKEYENKIIKKLISVKKNVNDNQFNVIFTKNPQLMKKFFGIIPEKNSDTVRLLDYSKKSEL